ncbi:hypothetical protein D3C77_363690 [compost metagenome]
MVTGEAAAAVLLERALALTRELARIQARLQYRVKKEQSQGQVLSLVQIRLELMSLQADNCKERQKLAPMERS